MELLASTCKILYDKDYLDSKEKLKKCLFIEDILFDDYYSYKIKKEEFFKTITSFVEETFTNTSTISFQNNLNDLSVNPLIVKFHKFLLDRIKIYLSNSNHEWAELVSYSFIQTLSSVLSSLWKYVEIDDNIIKNTILSSIYNMFVKTDKTLDRISSIKCINCKKYHKKVIIMGEALCTDCSKKFFY